MTSPLRKNCCAGPPWISAQPHRWRLTGTPASSATAGDRLATTMPRNGLSALDQCHLPLNRLGRGDELDHGLLLLATADVIDDGFMAYPPSPAGSQRPRTINRIILKGEDHITALEPRRRQRTVRIKLEIKPLPAGRDPCSRQCRPSHPASRHRPKGAGCARPFRRLNDGLHHVGRNGEANADGAA